MASNSINPMFTEEEILSIREGIDGVKHVLPARFYHDEAIYQHEVEHVLKKNWLCVGRWDQAENPGDYFTTRMWGESIIIVRDRQNELHALINVCQHRWSQVVEDGSGSTNMFMCPYHHWTYDLTGKLKGISVQDIPGVDKKKCAMPRLRVEEWHGFIFINFDQDAKSLTPQIEAVCPIFEKYQVGSYRQMDAVEYSTTWNWKFSFETGYEGYHHAGIHHDRINHIVPPSNTRPLDFGEACGSYTMWFAEGIPEEMKHPFGRPPWMKDGEPEEKETFVAIYPGLIMFLNECQCTYIIIQHQKVNSNCAVTAEAFAPWAIDAPHSKEMIAELTQMMRDVQDEDSFACSMLQKGITSKNNTGGMLHPLERQLNHYHNWYLDRMINH